MDLKAYQQQALETLDRYLEALKDARKKADELSAFNINELPAVAREQFVALADEAEDYPRVAWDSLREAAALPGVSEDNGQDLIPEYIPRKAASGEPIPHVCLKVPTGGGKTLLGVEAVRRLKIGTGFLLWLVPTKAIYTQTWDAFRNREHPYRQILERVSGGKVKLFQKDDRFTRQDVEAYLCVMLLMLPAANREKNKEFLKIFRDSGGYASFFPPEDDIQGHQALLEKHPDLDTEDLPQLHRDSKQSVGVTSDHDFPDKLIKQSLFNVLKLLRPTVILDEAHKAYGSKKTENNRQFVEAVNRLNPCFVLELSATPKLGISNILVNISGIALKDEEMIKLPIQLRNFSNSDWKYTLAQTKATRDELEEAAKQFDSTDNRYIRPIAVIRVDRTGKKQRDGIRVHAEDVRDELQNLGVHPTHIKVKSSEQDELAGLDLLSPFCPVRYIITKDALKEGWDCSFAYLLTLLDNTTATTAMTQLMGRVMRQPHARATNHPKLDSCYVHCFNQKTGETVKNVKKGLEAEGLTGLAKFVEGPGQEQAKKTIHRRQQYRSMDIFLPQVLHKQGRRWRALDYERDILGAIDWNQFGPIEPVDLEDEERLQEIYATIHLQEDAVIEKQMQTSNKSGPDMKLEISFFVRRLSDVITNPWLAARVVKATLKGYREKGVDEAALYANRLYLSEILKNNLRERIDELSESIFRKKLSADQIRFNLEADVELNYKLEETLDVIVSEEDRPLTRSHGDELQLNLFEPVYEGEFNNLEKDFVIYLDEDKAIQWWHRVAAKQGYFLQGWRRERVYPDFVACVQHHKNGPQRIHVLETKGLQLKGNPDTEYKQKLLKTLETAYRNANVHGKMDVTYGTNKTMSFTMLFENSWKTELNEAMADSYQLNS